MKEESGENEAWEEGKKKVTEIAVTGMEWETRAFSPRADRWRCRNAAHVKQWVRNKKRCLERAAGIKRGCRL